MSQGRPFGQKIISIDSMQLVADFLNFLLNKFYHLQ